MTKAFAGLDAGELMNLKMLSLQEQHPRTSSSIWIHVTVPSYKIYILSPVSCCCSCTESLTFSEITFGPVLTNVSCLPHGKKLFSRPDNNIIIVSVCTSVARCQSSVKDHIRRQKRKELDLWSGVWTGVGWSWSADIMRTERPESLRD